PCVYDTGYSTYVYVSSATFRSCLQRPDGVLFFFSTNTPTTELYTLSLHDRSSDLADRRLLAWPADPFDHRPRQHFAVLRRFRLLDRKSTRLNSSHVAISYAVFCLKKKNSAVIPLITFRTLLSSCSVPP